MGIDIQLPVYVMSYDGILGITESVFFLRLLAFICNWLKLNRKNAKNGL